jgi:hypothetical protein
MGIKLQDVRQEFESLRLRHLSKVACFLLTHSLPLEVHQGHVYLVPGADDTHAWYCGISGFVGLN